MGLVKPIALSINSFDATSTNPIKFSFIVNGGNQVTKNRLTIRSQDTNQIVYQNIVETYNFEQTVIPSSLGLQNDYYYNFYFNTYDVNGTISEDSNSIQFYCLSEPTLNFVNLPSNFIVNNNKYTFTVQYHQEQSELIDGVKFYLYDSFDKVISESEIYGSSQSNTFSHTFNGFNNNEHYKVEAVVNTLNGMKKSTGKYEFSVRYYFPEMYSLLDLENDCTKGCIKIKSNVIVANGKTPIDYTPELYYPWFHVKDEEKEDYIKWNEPYHQDGLTDVLISEWTEPLLDVHETDNWVKWNEGFYINSDFTFTLFVKPSNIGDFAEFGDKNNGFIFSLIREVPYGQNKVKDCIEIRGYKNGELKVLQRSPYVDLMNNLTYYMLWFRKVGNKYDIKLNVMEKGTNELICGYDFGSNVNNSIQYSENILNSENFAWKNTQSDTINVKSKFIGLVANTKYKLIINNPINVLLDFYTYITDSYATTTMFPTPLLENGEEVGCYFEIENNKNMFISIRLPNSSLSEAKTYDIQLLQQINNVQIGKNLFNGKWVELSNSGNLAYGYMELNKNKKYRMKVFTDGYAMNNSISSKYSAIGEWSLSTGRVVEYISPNNETTEQMFGSHDKLLRIGLLKTNGEQITLEEASQVQVQVEEIQDESDPTIFEPYYETIIPSEDDNTDKEVIEPKSNIDFEFFTDISWNEENYIEGEEFVPMAEDIDEIFPLTNVLLTRGLYDHMDITDDTSFAYSTSKRDWDYYTKLNCDFDDNIMGGNVDILFDNIQSIKIKRRKSGTFDWITFREVPIHSYDDLSILLEDYFLPTRYNVDYAIVPVLENGVEGNYIINHIETNYPVTLVADDENVFNVKAITYGGTIRNSVVGTYQPLKGLYPIIGKNSELDYYSGSITVKMLGYNYNKNSVKLDRFDIAKQTDDFCKFVNNDKAKILKDWNGNIYLIRFNGSPSVSYIDNYGSGITEVTANWIEQGKFDNQKDLYNNGLVNAI